MKSLPDKVRIILIVAILLGFGGVFAILSAITPLALDDYFNLFFHDRGVGLFQLDFDQTHVISTFSDLWTNAVNLYFSWLGRFFSIFFQPLISQLSPVAFGILNGCAGTLLLVLIVRNGVGRKRIAPTTLLLGGALLFLCAPAPGQVLFWRVGTLCYLWPAIFFMIVLWPFRSTLDAPGRKRGFLYEFCTGMVWWGAGLLACGTNENTGLAVIVMVFAFLFLIYRKQKKIPFSLWFALAGCVMGSAMLLFAPGNSARIAYEGYASPNLLRNFCLQTIYYWQQMPGLAALFVVLLTAAGAGRPWQKWLTPVEGIFLLGSLAAAYSMVFSPYSPGRAMFGAMYLLLVATLSIWERLPVEQWERLRVPVALVLSMMALVTAAYAFRDIAYCRNMHARREVAARQLAAEGEQEVVFRPICGSSRYNVLFKTDILQEDPGHFVNRYHASQWGVKSVRLRDAAGVVGMTEDIGVCEKE